MRTFFATLWVIIARIKNQTSFKMTSVFVVSNILVVLTAQSVSTNLVIGYVVILWVATIAGFALHWKSARAEVVESALPPGDRVDYSPDESLLTEFRRCHKYIE